jgi:adenylate kinase family enzyme
MKRVAVFGNAGGGKSTLARRLAELTGLPLYILDMIQFRADEGGAPRKVPQDEYLQAHAGLLRRQEWIIDGFGDEATAWQRFAVADTLIYVDLPLFTHYRFVTKRFISGLFANPRGWPDRSPIWSSTLSSYRVIPLCHRHLTPKYRQLVAEAVATKRVHHLRSPKQLQVFLAEIEREFTPSPPAASQQ